MLRIFVNFLIIFINFLNVIFENIFQINLKGFLISKLRQNYKSIKLKNNKIKFFTPSHVTDWRVNTFFEKEPETLKWIDNFQKSKKIVFWDIGSNIGLYSIYSAKIHKKIKVYSFEPSFLNLNVLGRNIYINNLQNKVRIFQLPLTNVVNKFQKMMETSIYEGGALSSFGLDKDFSGKKIKKINSYSILGTTLDDVVKKKIIQMPDYIKIDVDGLEHLILMGFKKGLKNKKIKSILIEVNENYNNQYVKIKKILKKNKFHLMQKEQSLLSRQGENAFKTYNYIYFRK